MYVGELALPGDGFRLPLPAGLAGRVRGNVGRHVVLGIRPEHFELGGGGGGDRGQLEAMLNVTEPLGSDMDVYLATRHHPHVVARITAQSGLRAGAPALLSVDLERAHVFEPEEAGANLTLERHQGTAA
jgi:multiple sugar transport system ATP-binding protein